LRPSFWKPINAPLHQATYEQFFTYFRQHPRTLLDLQRFAREAMQREDLETAIRHYSQIIENFEGRPAFYDALSSMARIYRDQEDQGNKARTLQRLITELDKNNVKDHLRVSAAYRLADMLRTAGPRQVEVAYRLFRDVRQRLEGADAQAYASTPAEAERNNCVFPAGFPLLFGPH
jgi:tetratricopeptide (TPR) repeat protein